MSKSMKVNAPFPTPESIAAQMARDAARFHKRRAVVYCEGRPVAASNGKLTLVVRVVKP
jgi:hypothetical protein